MTQESTFALRGWSRLPYQLLAHQFSLHSRFLSSTEFFAKVGDVRSVRMRRHLSSKDFRGSVFVELSSTEEAQRVGMECLMG